MRFGRFCQSVAHACHNGDGGGPANQPWQSVPNLSTCVGSPGLFKVAFGRPGGVPHGSRAAKATTDACAPLWTRLWGTRTLAIHPIIVKLACVAVVVVVVFPLGMMLFPYIADEIGGMPFKTLEAMLSATLGLGLYTALFG